MTDGTVRWLSDEEQVVWREFLAATAMLNAHLDRRLQDDAGMPQTYYAVLVALSESAGTSLRMSELAELVQFSRSRLSHAIARMESAGWVQRTSCPSDRRGAYVELTSAGLAVLRSAAPGHAEAVREALFDVLDREQIAQLAAISAAIRANLQPTCDAVAAEEFGQRES